MIRNLKIYVSCFQYTFCKTSTWLSKICLKLFLELFSHVSYIILYFHYSCQVQVVCCSHLTCIKFFNTFSSISTFPDYATSVPNHFYLLNLVSFLSKMLKLYFSKLNCIVKNNFRMPFMLWHYKNTSDFSRLIYITHFRYIILLFLFAHLRLLALRFVCYFMEFWKH